MNHLKPTMKVLPLILAGLATVGTVGGYTLGKSSSNEVPQVVPTEVVQPVEVSEKVGRVYSFYSYAGNERFDSQYTSSFDGKYNTIIYDDGYTETVWLGHNEFEIVDKYGETYKGSWLKDNGYYVLIGDTVTTEKGEELQVSFVSFYPVDSLKVW